MRILIIEDEPLAAENLAVLIKKVSPESEVLCMLDSVQTAVEWFQQNETPDLAFCDVQLGDGLSFEIFEQVKIDCPVIFTTAYDEYALKAFQVNSVDYLLKPLSPKDLEKAIEKFKSRFQNSETSQQQFQFPNKQLLQMLTANYKTRFLIKVGEHIKNIKIEDINWFYTMEKNTFMHTNSGKDFPMDNSLDQLELLVNPQDFFRINRKYFIHIDSIEDIISYSNSRLRLKLQNNKDDSIIVSREKVRDFKAWLDR